MYFAKAGRGIYRCAGQCAEIVAEMGQSLPKCECTPAGRWRRFVLDNTPDPEKNLIQVFVAPNGLPMTYTCLTEDFPEPGALLNLELSSGPGPLSGLYEVLQARFDDECGNHYQMVVQRVGGLNEQLSVYILQYMGYGR